MTLVYLFDSIIARFLFTEQLISTLIVTWLIPIYLLDVYIDWIPLPFRRVIWAFKTNTL